MRRILIAARQTNRGRDVGAIFLLAIGLRLVFALLIGNTYDYDEFVLLLLGRDYAHGAVPYAQFMFFHPPGALILLRVLEPITSLWWPAGRVFMLAVDASTAALLCSIGTRALGRSNGMVAGMLYAFSPLALVASVRVGQDPLMTFLLVLGLFVLVRWQNRRTAVIAGGCLALAIWVKYPALAFLPVYLVLARRRALAVVAGVVIGLALMLLPFLPQIPALYHQTIEFQQTRWKMPLGIRLETVGIWWLLVSPFAVLALRSRQPIWLKVGFLTGSAFLLASQVYYHYFVAVVPFASLLGAPVAQRMVRVAPRVALAAGAAVFVAWAATIARGGPSPLYVTAAHLSSVRPTVRILEKRTANTQAVLADRFEYQYLANRPALDDYFWNIGVLVDARYLEDRAPKAGAVIMSYGASSGYPLGFSAWLDRHYRRLNTGSTTVWLTADPRKTR